MQRTADFHDQIADPRLSQATDSVDDAAALDAAVDVLDAHTSAGDAPMRRFLGPRELSSSRLPGRSWSNRLPAGKGYGVASAIR
jgi:hypothetical protein